MGQLGLVETLALVLAIAWLRFPRNPVSDLNARILLGVVTAAFAFSFVAAFLTFAGSQQALRTIGGYPLMMTLTGAIIHFSSSRFAFLPGLACVLAAVGFAWFSYDYFERYPARAAAHYDATIVAAVRATRDKSPEAFDAAIKRVDPQYELLAGLYYALSEGGMRCTGKPNLHWP